MLVPRVRGATLPKHVLIAGASTRAAAESAAQAGFVVTAIDAFGDLDQHPSVRSLSLPRDFSVPFTVQAAVHAAQSIECDAVAYLSNFENYPQAVGTLAAGRALWGNSPAVLQRVRDPRLVMHALRRRGSAAAAVCGNPARVDPNDPDNGSACTEVPPQENGSRRWLVKPLASGGGHGVRPWRHATRVPRGCYLQELVHGLPGSVIFVAWGGRAVPLGLTLQLVGEHAFGAAGYQYCGNILVGAGDAQVPHDDALVEATTALARAVAEEFGVVGVNGIDFIAREGSPCAIEVNPRWSASMELVERAYGVSMFAAHAAACDGGALPQFNLGQARRGAGAIGKAVIFARQAVAVGDTHAWLADTASVRDVPHPGERIASGRPVCTVFAAGRDAAACHRALVRRAEHVYEQLAEWEQR